MKKIYKSYFATLIAITMLATNAYGNTAFIRPNINFYSVGHAPVMPFYHQVYENQPYYIISQYHLAYMNGDRVQLLHWEVVREMITLNTPFKVFDVKTGIIYFMESFSNGNHADVRPVTSYDTNLLFYTFGNEWSWDVRPVWVTINGITIAASINGQPHGGQYMRHNNMLGHVCLHFFGSSVHNGNLAFAQLHQDVLLNAYSLSNPINYYIIYKHEELSYY